MENKSYSYLKSGTDVRGVAIKSSKRDVELTERAVYDITCAFFKWLGARLNAKNLKIAVGQDVRISGERIMSAVKSAAVRCKVSLINCGVSSTPAMFMLLKKSNWRADGSIMITASHMPYDKNGLKFFTADGGLEGSDISEILNMADRGEKFSGEQGGYEEKSFMDDYCALLVDAVRTECGKAQPLKGKKIIVDAGNGVGGFFADKVLAPLGANTEGSQFLEHDGLFPNHAPNPEDKQAIKSLAQAVLKSGAELGIIFDTDVDRAGAVDGDGTEINRNRLIALTAATVLEKVAGGTVVTDSVTSDGLTEFINSLGGKHVRFKRGYRNVIDEAKRREEYGESCPLAMETSGHAAFKENYFLDDGAYLMCKLLVILAKQAEKGRTLCELINPLRIPVEEAEIRIGFNANSRNFKEEGARVIEEVKFFAAADKSVKLADDNYEGARIAYPVNGGDGWSLIRMSVHDPVMPMNFESDSVGGNKIMAAKMYSLLRKFPFLELSALEKFIKF